ncbi:Adenylate and Guanylate cyclase catalytic domain-containing protein [Mucilaginibacter pineti]|uniref:Adenylate and Guanylate cyclase catalytic domain-containing protein n=1 Tax=Mucilaginibacter pineti TaxID=1391627 RepID=A0A1G7L2V0_9SPHI|nr:adenylate/guanylate cyclase domain-containing protein [Mucilaginibacter pineti]SDF43773.1 Adenylate and Guanylate cyclase catalytic domain-containing protein [Mucilaginibacter pineti]
MHIFDDYVKPIRAAIAADPKSGKLYETLSFSERSLQKGLDFKVFNQQVPEKRLLPNLADFARELGLTPNFEQGLGLHPDFSHLKHSESLEDHYIVSMFVDIKGSTNLFKKYTPRTVWIITNTIQRAAIHTCLIFGGYVHRLQGDGLFVYFGGKNMKPDLAVKRALQFSSVFTYFVKEDLKNIFIEQGIENIYTRIGIDLGYDTDVIWGMAGIGEISEVTTCSLHTSLASKMQSYAVSNGIVVGDHVKNESPALTEFYTPVCHRTQRENDRYIFQIPEERFNYTQYDFNWLNFLKRQDFIATDLSGQLQLKQKAVVIPNRNIANLAPIAAVSKPYYGFES